MNVHADRSAAKPARESKYLYLLLVLTGFVLLVPLQRDMGIAFRLIDTAFPASFRWTPAGGWFDWSGGG